MATPTPPKPNPRPNPQPHPAPTPAPRPKVDCEKVKHTAEAMIATGDPNMIAIAKFLLAVTHCQ